MVCLCSYRGSLLLLIPLSESIRNDEGGSLNSELVKDANGLFYGTVFFKFIVCLVIVSRLLDIT